MIVSGNWLQYYFEVKITAGKTLLCPGFSRDLTNQPYIVVRSIEGAGVGVRLFLKGYQV